jgi:hypothetical protein
MPDKHPNTDRWGGPGASHEMVKDADDPDRYSRHSKVSGGGGETDVHHGHDPKMKRDFEANDAQKRKN